jgi:uncharacterized membrane protein YeaQ/YmgE (transglycosylase-associated protein family)
VFGVIFWLVLGTGVLVIYRQLRRHSGWAACVEVVLGIIGAAAAEAAIRLSSWAVFQSPAAQILAAVAGALLLAVTARWLVPRKE